jgi:multiple sugar transport system substrate-binding protein
LSYIKINAKNFILKWGGFRMKSIKKILAVALTGIMVAGIFTGCGSKGSSKDEASSKGKKDVITLWTYPNYRGNKELGTKGYEELIQDIIAKYNETHPNVEVKYEILSWAEGGQKFDIAVNSGNPPDLMYTVAQSKYAKTGLAVPIDEFITEEDKNDFAPFAIDRYKIDGKQYGLPTWISTHCLGGNKRYFEEAGIDYKKIMKEGWTWEEFKQCAKKMTKTVDDKTVYGFITQKDDEMLRHLLMSNGMGTGLTEDEKFSYDEQGMIETLNFIKSMIDEGIMPKETAGIDSQKMTDMFNNSEAAIFGRVGPYQIRFNNNRNKSIDEGKTEGEKQEIILLPFPHSSKYKNVVYGDCGGYMVFRQKKDKGEDHKKNVVDLLKMVTGTESSIASAKVFTTPARKSGQKKIDGMIQADAENLEFMNLAPSIIQSRPILNPETDNKLSQVKKETIIPLYQAFLAGEIESEEMSKQVMKKAKEVFGE